MEPKRDQDEAKTTKMKPRGHCPSLCTESSDEGDDNENLEEKVPGHPLFGTENRFSGQRACMGEAL